MAAGLPVVATAVGDLPTTLGPDGGVLVPPGDAQALSEAMRDMLRDPGMRTRLARRAETVVAPYLDAPRWIAETEAIYRSVLGDGDARIR
jgi:glycosyltransferase involved in cell wall biosynthesis